MALPIISVHVYSGWCGIQLNIVGLQCLVGACYLVQGDIDC